MAKGDKPVGRVIATKKTSKHKVEIGTLWATKLRGVYGLSFSREDRKSENPKFPDRVKASRVFERLDEVFIDVKLSKAECERLSGTGASAEDWTGGGGRDAPAPDSGPGASDDDDIPFAPWRMP